MLDLIIWVGGIFLIGLVLFEALALTAYLLETKDR